MSLIKELENKIKNVFIDLGYEIDNISLINSSREDLGMYQINDAMKLSKIYHENPVEIANKVKEELDKLNEFTNINIAGPGFINITLSNEKLKEYLNSINFDINNLIDKKTSKDIVIDYGGANIAKELHVGHLRSANIGEALKRLAKTLGDNVISDAHLGDYGLQVGTVIFEIRNRYPDLICFKDDYNGEDFEFNITNEELSNIYPTGSKKIKENEEYHEIAKKITLDMQKGHPGYNKLWEKVSSVSLNEIKKIYNVLNTEFDLYEGERDSIPYIKEVLNIGKEKNMLYLSDGATVMDIKKDTDTKEMPPIILVKNDGAYLYGTTDLATIYGRVKRFNPNEIWYVIDNRQSLHIEQVERAARKLNIINDDVIINFIGFGTMNGKDGKPFKTREGNAMSLENLIDIVNNETYNRLNPSIIDEEEKEKISKMLAIAAIKYADFLPFRATDYIFDPVKFADLEGKTGPYLLYTVVRIKSLLKKANELNIEYNKINEITNIEKDLCKKIIDISKILISSYNMKSLNEIAEYLYELASLYNKFYNENKIITEENIEKRETWLTLSNIILNELLYLLDILAIKCPDKM